MSRIIIISLKNKSCPIEPTPWVDSLNNSKSEISISPNPTSGLVNCQVNGDFMVTVSPNPTSGQVTILISESEETALDWVLTDNNGKIMISNKVISPNFTLDLSVYANGTYYLVLQDDSGKIKQTVQILKL